VNLKDRSHESLSTSAVNTASSFTSSPSLTSTYMVKFKKMKEAFEALQEYEMTLRIEEKEVKKRMVDEEEFEYMARMQKYEEHKWRPSTCDLIDQW
jgi:hypothetical protein